MLSHVHSIASIGGRASDFWSRGPGFKTIYCRFEAWATSFSPLCLSEDSKTVKAVGVGHFYVVCMLEEVKDPMQGNGKKPVVDSQSW